MATAKELREQAQRLLDKAEELSTQLTEADVKAMWAEGRHADIVQAKADGRLDTYMNQTTTEEN